MPLNGLSPTDDLVERLTRYRARLAAQDRALALPALDRAIAEARAALADRSAAADESKR